MKDIAIDFMLLKLYMKMEVLTKDVYKYTNKYKMKSLYITICIILGIALLPISGGFYILDEDNCNYGAIAASIQNSSRNKYMEHYIWNNSNII